MGPERELSCYDRTGLGAASGEVSTLLRSGDPLDPSLSCATQRRFASPMEPRTPKQFAVDH